MKIKMLKSVGSYAANSEVDIDSETAALYVEKKYAEEVKPDADSLTDTVLKHIDNQIAEVKSEIRNELAKEFKEKAKVKLPAVAKENDWSFKEWICLVGKAAPGSMSREKAIDVLTNKYSQKAATLGTDSSLGYLAPDQFVTNELLSIEGFDSILSLCKKYEMPQTDTLKLVIENQTGTPSGSSSAFNGNLSAGVVAEGSAPSTSQDLPIDQITITSKAFRAFSYVTNEMLDHSPANVAQIVQNSLVKLGTKTVDYQLFNGTDFTGIIGHASTITVGRDNANLFNLVDAANMYARLPSDSQGKAIWVMHPYHIAALITMNSTNGALTWIPNAYNGLPQLQLLGNKVYRSEFTGGVGSTGDVLLMDPSYYVYGVSRALEVTPSSDYKFNEDMTTFRLRLKMGGRPALNTPVKLNNGGSVSPFVLLDNEAS